MSLMLLTFKTNHTILGDVEKTSAYYLVKKPVQVVMQQTKEGAAAGFVPFLEFSEDFMTGIKIQFSDILTETMPVVELVNQYNQIFGSGIQIASAMPGRG